MRKISRFGLFDNKKPLGDDAGGSSNRSAAGNASAVRKLKQEYQIHHADRPTSPSSIASPTDAVVASGSLAVAAPPVVFGGSSQNSRDDPPSWATSKRPRLSNDGLDRGRIPPVQESHNNHAIDRSSSRIVCDSIDSGDESDTLEALLSSSYIEGSDKTKIEMVWTMYEKKRRAYKKYKDRADKAQEEMHRLTKVLFHLVNGDRRRDSVQNTTRGEDVYQTHPVRSPVSSKPLALSPPPTAYSRTGNPRSGSFSSGDESMASPSADLNKPTWWTMQRTSSKASSAGTAPEPTLRSTASILSEEVPKRAFQFSTQSFKAFQLKPRAAMVCTFDGIAGQTAVAYGFDGTVQFWDPSTRTQFLSIERNTLQMDLIEQVTQLTPSLIAVLAGGSTKGSYYYKKGTFGLLSKKPHLKQNDLRFGPPTYLTESPHFGEIISIEGMPDCSRNYSDTAFMLSGGDTDKSVHMWAIGLSEKGSASSVRRTLKMKTHHTTRVSALCYEPSRGYAISGSDGTGRISVNDSETGKLVVDTDNRPCGGGIGGISLCPVDPNLAMVSCTAKGKQVQLFDLRQSLSNLKPVLSLGKDEGFRNSRYIRSAWHPNGRLVFCPLNEEGTSASGNGTLNIWDVRYFRCQEEEPQTYSPHRGSIWSASFARPSHNADSSSKPILITTSSDRNIAFTNFSI